MSHMRDPNRINRIMLLIHQVWQKQPDMRFFQLLSWIEFEYSKSNNDFGRRELIYREQSGFETNYPVIDLFYLEDDQIENFLQGFLEKMRG